MVSLFSLLFIAGCGNEQQQVQQTQSQTPTTEAPKTEVTTTTENKPGLPNTGEGKGTLVTIIGFATLISSIVAIAFLRKNEKNKVKD